MNNAEAVMVKRFCLVCGTTAQRADVFCANCGQRIEHGPWESWGERLSLGHRWYLGLRLLAAAILLGILALGTVGLWQGYSQRTSVDLASAALHYERGRSYLEEGNYPLAVAEFEEAVRLNPQDTEAQRQLLRARTLVESQVTPSQALSQASLLLYQSAVDLVAQGDFGGAKQNLLELQRIDPQFRQEEVAALLFQAYLGTGRREVEDGDVAAALAEFEAALALRPDDPQAGEEVRLASLYLESLASWDADWAFVVSGLEEIYAAQPDYADVESRLVAAHRTWAEQLEDAGSWCAAEREYTRVLELSPNEEARNRKEIAAKRCQDQVSSSTITGSGES